MHDSLIFIREEGVTSPRELEEKKKENQTKALKFCGESKRSLCFSLLSCIGTEGPK